MEQACKEVCGEMQISKIALTTCAVLFALALAACVYAAPQVTGATIKNPDINVDYALSETIAGAPTVPIYQFGYQVEIYYASGSVYRVTFTAFKPDGSTGGSFTYTRDDPINFVRDTYAYFGFNPDVKGLWRLKFDLQDTAGNTVTKEYYVNVGDQASGQPSPPPSGQQPAQPQPLTPQPGIPQDAQKTIDKVGDFIGKYRFWILLGLGVVLVALLAKRGGGK